MASRWRQLIPRRNKPHLATLQASLLAHMTDRKFCLRSRVQAYPVLSHDRRLGVCRRRRPANILHRHRFGSRARLPYNSTPTLLAQRPKGLSLGHICAALLCVSPLLRQKGSLASTVRARYTSW